MHPDSQTRELRVGSWLPGSRTDGDEVGSEWALSQETMLLPAFLTGAGATPPPPPAPAAAPAAAPPANPDKLPSSERNMLIFVALLLATGTMAILAMATL